jgi:hypothetical protein
MPAIGQEKAKATGAEKGKVSSRVIAETEKVRVLEIRIPPAAINQSPPSSFTRVVRALKGGTFVRTYPDGKTETIVIKTGDTRINPPGGPYTVKNIGKTELVFYVVVVK